MRRCASFYLVGIGGAGMSGLARMLKRRGFDVRGVDAVGSAATEELVREGIPVQIGHSGDGPKEGDAVVLTDAIDLAASPEVAAARRMGLPLFRRSQALGWLLEKYRVIAVTGTHGKTTTTGMIGSALLEAGMDPLIVVGASVPQWGGPVVEGAGQWAVVEACEAYDSFHDVQPEIVVLTNLEADHLDFHESYENLRASVVRFASTANLLIFAVADPGACEVADRCEMAKIPYELPEEGQGSGPEPALIGDHNRLNAAGALRAAIAAGADAAKAAKGIAEFRGAERRLQILREGEVVVIDDYAHHPTEIEESLKAIRAARQGRLVVVFQPHLYSRTKDLIPEFASALSLADYVVLTDIYPAREAPIAGVSSACIAELITKPCLHVPSRHFLPEEVARLVRPGDVVVAMGAGNIGEFATGFIRLLDRKALPGRKTRVAVFYGGDNGEREVSLISGASVYRALLAKGYDAWLVDPTEMLIGKADLSPITGANRPDLVFLALHGTHMEGGGAQGLCQLLHLPYTGSGLLASALAMDKEQTKRRLAAVGLPVPGGVLLTSPAGKVALKPPLVVKPNSLGSTVGLSFVETDAELQGAIERAFAYDVAVLVEEWIQGMEISAPVLGDRALPAVEIVPASGRYDFASKYRAGATEEVVPARLSEDLTARVQEYALKSHQTLGCSGATRTDMMVRGEEVFILEVNTLPGMTPTSLLPNSARSTGMSFEDLVDWIVQDALVRNVAKT
jgi:D-alanine--D-alanine ligase